MCFDFTPFGVDKRVTSLQDFVAFIDTFDCQNFDAPHVFLSIAKNVASGLSHLHSIGVAIAM